MQWVPRRSEGPVRSGWISGLLALSLLAAACASDDDDRPVGPTVPSGGSSTTTSMTVAPTSTTVPAASYDVPEVINQAYVQRVVSAYDEVLGDAIRVLKRDGGVSEEFLKHLLAIYSEQEFEFQQRFWLESVDGGVVAKYRDQPGDPRNEVLRLARADRQCLVTEVRQSYSEVLRDGVDPAATPQDDYLVLVQKTAARDPLSLNPTPWVVAFSGFKTDNSAPFDKCGP